jgi:hypothetical protein
MLDAAKGTEALQLLQEELASEDAETHTHAMRRLCLVAAALGPERARKELVPFLSGEARARAHGGRRRCFCRPTAHPLARLRPCPAPFSRARARAPPFPSRRAR